MNQLIENDSTKWLARCNREKKNVFKRSCVTKLNNREWTAPLFNVIFKCAVPFSHCQIVYIQ